MSMKHQDSATPLSPGATTHGFRLERRVQLDGMSMTALEFRHTKTGARLLHLAADDPENIFGVAFRTPPPDDTGLPHILEHTVLCGSNRYPVKDPFVELLKTSLATFLNAFTYPDRTVYPCSSMNEADFRNLMRVYCDAVFFPVLSEDHFRQEGHHLEFPPDGPPIIKGVVFNEMRGVYSDPEGILERHVQRILFESNAYGRDFGGDPKSIPRLAYERFVEFHRTYYHPANAWIFTYGDAGWRETLRILDEEFLDRFDAPGPSDTGIGPLAAWNRPKTAEFPYPVDAGEDTREKTDIAVAFAANDSRDSLTTLAMKVVDAYFLDNAASPLRKALIDSKLGQELGSSGYADYQRDTFFGVTLKGSEPERAEAVENLILEVTRNEADRGFDKEKVESALHRLELEAREIKPQYPLRLLQRAYSVWLYDSDPLDQIRIADRLDELRAAMAADGRYLEKLAKKWIADNPHRLRVTLVPDKGYVERNDREAAADLEATLTSMTGEQKEEARTIARRLERMQSEGNSPEALATLPRLSLSDVSPVPTPLACEAATAGGLDFVRTPMFSDGVSYLNLSLEPAGLDEDDIDHLPLLCEAISKSGAAGLDYAAMAGREAACTGALEFVAGLVGHVDGPDKARLKLGVRLKALESDWEKALEVMADRLFRADFNNTDRLRDIVLQSRMAWRNQIVPAGNAYASLYAAGGLNPAAAALERLTGCTQARFIDRLAANLDALLPSLPDRLAALRDKALKGAAAAAGQVGGERCMASSQAWLAGLAGRFKPVRDEAQTALPRPGAGARRIGLAAPADVAYAARTLPCPPLSDPDAPALLLLGQQLSYGYLWNEIRVKGGAYGARAAFNGAHGVFAFSSYRDPNIFRTLAAYDGAAGFVAGEMDLSLEGLEQAIIGTVKTLDQPMRPPSAAVAALNRRLGGETEAFRRDFRSRLLSLGADDVRAAARRLFAAMEGAPVCVISSRERLAGENARAGEEKLDIRPLWETAGGEQGSAR